MAREGLECGVRSLGGAALTGAGLQVALRKQRRDGRRVVDAVKFLI